MRKVELFIAMSLDGYIAGQDGNVDWLSGQEKEAATLDTYSPFIAQVDSIVMGWNTYHQIVTELSPDRWVYEGRTTYVVTHRKLAPSREIIFTAKDPCELVRELKQKPGKNIWICGGAAVVQPLAAADLIDRYTISIIPTLLGSGLRLFGRTERELPLRLVSTLQHNGITDLVYERRARKQGEKNEEEMEIWKIREHSELAEQAAAWFHAKWGVPQEAYRASLQECLQGSGGVPQWYAAVKHGKIAAGIGVIENDFHNRKDLTPNVCALYVENEYRGKGLAGRLLQAVCQDMAAFGIDTLYLLTDHTSFYERYGWDFLCMVQGDGEAAPSRMYLHKNKGL